MTALLRRSAKTRVLGRALFVVGAALVALFVTLNYFGQYLPDRIQCAIGAAFCDPPMPISHVTYMKSDLRNLITAQEAYFAEHDHTYAPQLDALGTSFRASSGVTVKITSVSATGWTASAANPATPKTCQITLGDQSTTEGDPICK